MIRTGSSSLQQVSWAAFWKIRYLGCLCNSLCMCVWTVHLHGETVHRISSLSTQALKDQTSHYATATGRILLLPLQAVAIMFCKLFLILVNMVRLSPSNWLQPTELLHQVHNKSVDVTHCLLSCQSMMWLHFCGVTGVAILFRLPLTTGKGGFRLTSVGWCSRAARCLSSASITLASFLFAAKLRTSFITLTVSRLTELCFFRKLFKRSLLESQFWQSSTSSDQFWYSFC